ncbi:hypothetical protein [Sphingopyxis sp. LC81]|uniref:hypothetical protein n=1 Tax=Sphingopyxis sp. LC81 TaxID=1502850 RepID=UPI00126A7703|nr:hypothetical protein [Sphingopyxis sp. LC81]
MIDGFISHSPLCAAFSAMDTVTAIGYACGRDHTTGIGFCGAGVYAGGYYNADRTTVFGTFALSGAQGEGSTYGDNNAIFGFAAAGANSGARNAAFGSESLRFGSGSEIAPFRFPCRILEYGRLEKHICRHARGQSCQPEGGCSQFDRDRRRHLY